MVNERRGGPSGPQRALFAPRGPPASERFGPTMESMAEPAPTTELEPEVRAGAAVYSPIVLSLYDLVVVHLSCRHVWRCPSSQLRALYGRNLGPRHLDVGPGSGYYLDRSPFPVDEPEVTLLDLNPSSLA